MMNDPMPEFSNGRSADENLQARMDSASGSRQGAVTAGRADFSPEMYSSASSIEMLMDVTLQLTVELGRTRMTVRQVLDLAHGSVVELERLAGEAVDIYVNDHKLARGEVVVVDDKFGVRITEMIKPKIGER